jgi:hypothetical protein
VDQLSHQFSKTVIEPVACPTDFKQAKVLLDAAILKFAAHATTSTSPSSATLLADVISLHAALRDITPFVKADGPDSVFGSSRGGTLHHLHSVLLHDQARDQPRITPRILQEFHKLLKLFPHDKITFNSFYLAPLWAYGAVVCHAKPQLHYRTGLPMFRPNPGVFVQNTPVRWIPFTRMQHAVHDAVNAVRILTDTPGQATFATWRTHNDYGVYLWWLAPQPCGVVNTHVPSLNPHDSRYGGIVFTFPVDLIFGGRQSFILGTRVYKRECSLTMLVTKQHESFASFGGDLPQVNTTGNALFRKQHGRWQWACSRETDYEWDHAEVAVQLPVPVDFNTSEVSRPQIQLSASEGVRIHFVAHNDFCVVNKSPVNPPHGNALACRCTSRQAMQSFIEACRQYDVKERLDEDTLIGSLKAFFEPQVWKELMTVEAARFVQVDKSPATPDSDQDEQAN